MARGILVSRMWWVKRGGGCGRIRDFEGEKLDRGLWVTWWGEGARRGVTFAGCRIYFFYSEIEKRERAEVFALLLRSFSLFPSSSSPREKRLSQSFVSSLSLAKEGAD